MSFGEILPDAVPTQLQITGEYFDSRTEAMWGIYFRAVGIPYVREPQAFALPGVGLYVPDFYLEDQNCYVEIKNDNVNELATAKARSLAVYEKAACLLINRRPHNFAMFLYSPERIHPFGNTDKWGADYRFISQEMGSSYANAKTELGRTINLGRIAAHNTRLKRASSEAILAAQTRRDELCANPKRYEDDH